MFIRRLVVYYCCWVFFYTCASSASSTHSSNNSSNTKVLEAIKICRDKLNEDPHFVKIQHSLAQLLDSQIGSDNDDVDVNEVIQLYLSVGKPSSHNVIRKRLPPSKVKFESLTRAATIAKEVLHDNQASIRYYIMAIHLDGVEEASLLMAFETVMPLLINNINPHKTEIIISADGTIISDVNGSSCLDICNLVETKLPAISMVDEYRGALFRRLKQPQLAYESYHKAYIKSKQQMESDIGNIDLVNGFLHTSILVAAASREAGRDLEHQIQYLNEAEQVAKPLLKNIDDIDEQSQDVFRDGIVDLYNNLGIAEKKQGSIKRAQEYFRRALEINPNDGHATVQLSSIDESSTDNVKRLDNEYVSSLFDGYSSRFESELVDILHYKGHSLVYNALVSALKQLGRSLSSVKKVVDCGCGTGLLGELIASNMSWVELSGVDLSHRMIAVSYERKSIYGREVYNAGLGKGDAAFYLSSLEKESIDCILASDVFIYVGDISALLHESFKCLARRGLIVFTVESYDDEEGEFRLLKSGRFGHSKQYIEQVAKLNGFEVLTWEDCILRQQGGQDVKGATVVLKKI